MKNLHDIGKDKVKEEKENIYKIFDSFTAIDKSSWGTYKDYYTVPSTYEWKVSTDWVTVGTIDKTFEYINAACTVCGTVITGILPEGKTRMNVIHTGAPNNRNGHRADYQ